MNDFFHNRNNFKYALIFVLFSLFISDSFSQTIFLKQPADTSARIRHDSVKTLKNLQQDLESIIYSKDFENSFIGVYIKSMKSGKVYLKLNESKNFIPASTNKIITTSAAIDFLGPNFRFLTQVYLDGVLEENGEFVGNIIIRGSGDPSFSSTFDKNPVLMFDSWAEKLDSFGIRSIKGNIIADDRYFDNYFYPPGWAVDDIIHPYSAQISALSVNDNKVDVLIKPGSKPGELAKITIEPPNNYIRIINNIITLPESEPTEILPSRDINSNIFELKGTIAIDTAKNEDIKVSLAVHNPSIFFLNLFKMALEKTNIKFRGGLFNMYDLYESISYLELNPFISEMSAPLKEIVVKINQRSLNLPSEILLKTIAKESSGEGSFSSGIEKIKQYLSKKGINTESLNIVDGSGLSRLNFISPFTQVSLLENLFESSQGKDFLYSLAVPGKEGTLSKRMLNSRAEYNVYAKTGSMNGVSNICGYVFTKDGDPLAFSIMMMNFSVPDNLAKNLQDLILMRLASIIVKY